MAKGRYGDFGGQYIPETLMNEIHKLEEANEFYKHDKQFNDEMTLSGSKVETIERLDESLKHVVAGRILSMEKHPDSDHMGVCQLDAGREEPVQIVTGAWNIHIGDLVPAALHKSVLPGGVKIEKGKLRGVPAYGMLCALKERGLTAEHDFPYAVITPAALLNDYHPIDPAKPSIPADIKPGDKVFGPVAAAKVLECAPQGDGVRELGPTPAPLSLLRGKYRYRLLLQTGRRIKIQNVLQSWLSRLSLPSSVRVQTDIDPYIFF